MKILWVSDKEGVLGGGSTSERTLLRYLVGTDHDLSHVVATALTGSVLAKGPFELRQKIMGKILKYYVRSRIQRFGVPDVIVSQGIYYPQIGELATDCEVPHLVFIRDQFYRCPGAQHRPCNGSCFMCVPTGQKVLWPLVRNLIKQKIRGLSFSEMVLANSHFMKKDLEEHTDKTVNVLFPPVDFPIGDGLPGPGDKILYMGCGYWKGTDLVMKLARDLPKYDFLVAGDPEVLNKWDLKDYPNVEYHPWIDRNVAFDQGRILLFPSMWPEPFGRIPVEAGQRFIPTIGSNRGGVPESVGEGGVLLDPDGYEQWLAWVQVLMESDGLCDSLGRKAFDHSAQFGISKVGPKLEWYLDRVV